MQRNQYSFVFVSESEEIFDFSQDFQNIFSSENLEKNPNSKTFDFFFSN